MDAYYRSDPPLIVTRDPDAIGRKRPLKYIEHEKEEMQKNAKQIKDKTEYPAVEHVE